MRINKICLVVITLVNLFAVKQSKGMDQKPLTGKIDRESLIKSISAELPEMQDKKPQIESGFCEVVFRYNDNNFVQKFSELIGLRVMVIDEDLTEYSDAIRNSFKVRTGYWHVSDENNIHVSTGHVHECVTIVVQHEEPSFIGMYHYFERDDKDFEKLYEFFDALKNKATELSVNVSDFKVSLISSYLSFDFLMIKRCMLASGFNINFCHAPLRVCLNERHYVESNDYLDRPGRLILANHSGLKIYRDFGEFRGYDPDPGPDGEDCCVM